MSNTETLVDLADGSAVSNSSPQSPVGSTLLGTPITLDFDPMSFQLKEDSPLTSPSDNNDISPKQNAEEMDFFDPLRTIKPDSSSEDLDMYCASYKSESEEHLEVHEEQVQQNGFISVHAAMSEEVNTVEETVEINPPSDLLIESPSSSPPFNPFVPLENVDSDPEALDPEVLDPEPSFTSTSQSVTEATTNGEETLISPEIATTVEMPHIAITNVDAHQRLHDNDEVFQHDECDLSDSSERHGTGSSVSSTRSYKSSSSKSEKGEKKKTTKKKLSSTSSEGSIKDDDPKSPTQKSKKEEKITTQKEIIQEDKRKIITTKTERIVTKSYEAVNGLDKHEKSKNGNLDDDESSGEVEDKDTREIPECPVSVAQLKSSYTQHAKEERALSPSREIITTGVDIKSLKTSFSRTHDEEIYQTGPPEVKPSVDREKVALKFNQDGSPFDLQDGHDTGIEENVCLCKICGKHVYQMEKIKAEKSAFHKTCFRCKECGKSLNVDTYSSHEGELYCKPHFKILFQPKARFDEEDSAPKGAIPQTDELEQEEERPKRHEMIIRENVPIELPPDVIRSDTKPDYGLDTLPVNLSNIKSRFESFQEEHHLPSTADVCALQRSESIVSRMAKYQSAVSGENENGDISSPSEDECDDPNVVKETKHKEKVVFSGMSSLKSQWETGSVTAMKEERMEEKKEELNKLRQRMCLGRSESMKAVYEKACQDSTKTTPTRSDSVVLGRDVKATDIKEKFEKGDLDNEVDDRMERARKEKEEEFSVFTEPGTAVEAKKLFKQIDATAKTQGLTPSPTSPSKSPTNERKTKEIMYAVSSPNEIEVVKCSEPTAKDEISVDTTDLSQRFKYFENYKEEQKERKRFQITPPREGEKREDSPQPEIMRDPNVVRSADLQEDIPVTDTTRRMLDKFKALENAGETVPTGPKPLKRITPPREYTKADHESSPEPERDPNIVRASYKTEDDIVVEADKAKSLRAMFENWETEMRENKKNEEEEEEDYLPQIDTAKNLRAKFEAIKEETLKPIEKPKAKVNRFIQEQSGSTVELCNICGKKVYPMEKMETSGMRLHKNCFRCAHCSCMLRLENYTTSGGRLYCTPHFKQLFISRGNYDEGFGREQHKEKWNRNPAACDLNENGDLAEYTNGDLQCLEQMA